SFTQRCTNEIPGPQTKHRRQGMFVNHMLMLRSSAAWAQQAARRSANAEALNHLARGLELLPNIEDPTLRNKSELLLQTSLGNSLRATKGRLAPAEYEPGLLELGNSMLQCALVAADHRAQQGIGEVAPDRRADLADLPHRRPAVEACHQRMLKRLRDDERRQRPFEPIALGDPDQDARLQHRLGEFLDDQ